MRQQPARRRQRRDVPESRRDLDRPGPNPRRLEGGDRRVDVRLARRAVDPPADEPVEDQAPIEARRHEQRRVAEPPALDSEAGAHPGRRRRPEVGAGVALGRLQLRRPDVAHARA
jgi:anti-sigma factor RsiW